ncbi:hypothetical protein J1605_011007 [Eschrichtius robustus]|uniref:Uncharacterized protein n=1 Tax=Eschrichtius robustus TaxID=9764 RepID=A0AB34GQK5_ESCRO|nr:hypothetical protein J1605_011007 [Eschrichtius robustus]
MLGPREGGPEWSSEGDAAVRRHGNRTAGLGPGPTITRNSRSVLPHYSRDQGRSQPEATKVKPQIPRYHGRNLRNCTGRYRHAARQRVLNVMVPRRRRRNTTLSRKWSLDRAVKVVASCPRDQLSGGRS